MNDNSMRKWLFESALIVISILLAFAIQTWWEQVAESQQERQSLIGLKEEFETNVASLRSSIDDYSENRKEALKVLDLTNPSSRGDKNNETLLLLSQLIATTETFEPVEGTLSYLVSSEGLGMLSNGELRLHLIQWPRAVSKINDRQTRIREIMRQYFLPYIWTKIPVKVLDDIASSGLTNQTSSNSIDVSEMFSELEFQNIVNELLYSYTAEIEVLNDALALAETILGIVDDEIII